MEVYTQKILIVGCEIETKSILVKHLTILGYNVYLTSNSKDALALFDKLKPDLVLLELILPRLDGYKLCCKIRENYQVPIVILSALNNISDRVMGFEIGADDYIVKPFSLKELEVRVKALLRRSSYNIQNLSTRKKKGFRNW